MRPEITEGCEECWRCGRRPEVEVGEVVGCVIFRDNSVGVGHVYVIEKPRRVPTFLKMADPKRYGA